MSGKTEEVAGAAAGSGARPRTPVRVVTAHRQREGAGFIVRRPIGGEVDMVDPFLLLDHLGPTTYGPGEAVGAPDHPHRGFETVTYVLEGEMQHKDSAGNHGVLKEGWVQWMTAGSGLVHSETPGPEMMRTGGKQEGFQLWVNLPKKDKWVPPRYQDTPAKNMPVVALPADAGTVKVVAGSFEGHASVIETRIPIVYMDVRLRKGGSVTIPVAAGLNTFVYAYRGGMTVGGKAIKEGQMAMLGDGDQVKLSAPADAGNALVIGGKPINEPVARYGPFVMNTREEIIQCFEDYQAGKMGAIEGAEERHAQAREAVAKQKETGKWKADEL